MSQFDHPSHPVCKGNVSAPRGWLRRLALWGLCLPALLSLGATAGAQSTITAQTTACNGATGYAAFEMYRFYKMQPAGCHVPGHPDQPLMQILLKSHSAFTRYEVLTVTPAEAERIQQQIAGPGQPHGPPAEPQPRTYPQNQPMPKAVVQSPPSSDRAEREVVTKRSTDPSQDDKDHTTADRQQGDDGPRIAILDPPLSHTRGIPNIVTATRSGGRHIVGQVDAPTGLVAVTVNGKKQKLESDGLFQTTVAVEDRRTPVTIVAVDKGGQRQSFKFYLVPEDSKRSTPSKRKDTGFGDYYALLIGNNDHEHLNDLRTPINDVSAIGHILRDRYGFEVTTLTDVTRYELLSALSRLRKQLTGDDNLLIYYAGHGEYDAANQRAHWLPVDAEPDSTANWISTVDITDNINRFSAKHVLVVADSCYSGALTRSIMTELDPGMSESARAEWLSVMAEQPSRTVLTSGGVKPVLDGGGGEHSVFAQAFIDVLQQNQAILEGAQLYRAIKERLAQSNEANELEQVPEYAPLKRTGHAFSDFLLVARQPEASAE